MKPNWNTVRGFRLCRQLAHGGVLYEIGIERVRQNHKWGEQNHPDFADMPVVMRPLHYEIPTKADAIKVCDGRAEDGTLTWADILIEEVAEAIETRTPGELREELIQVAAVAIAWVEAIDRRRLKRGDAIVTQGGEVCLVLEEKDVTLVCYSVFHNKQTEVGRSFARRATDEDLDAAYDGQKIRDLVIDAAGSLLGGQE